MDLSFLYKNILNIYGKLSSILPGGRALPPIHAKLELTYSCNLRCKMCYQKGIRSTRSKLIRNEMTTDEIKSVVNWMKPNTLITLTGGEIFTMKNSLEIIDYVCEHHHCNIVTNAVLINKKVAESLVRSGVIVLGVSIDGIGKAHDEIRKVKGTFAKAINAIKLIQKIKKESGKKYPLIDIKMVVLEENVEEIQKLYELAKELNADYLTISMERKESAMATPPIKRSFSPKELSVFPRATSTIDGELLKKQIEKILNNSSKSPIIRLYPDDADRVLFKYFTNEMSIDNYHDCKFPWATICISPYGDVFPCFQINMGNIRRTSLNDIWNGIEYRKFRSELKTKGVFPACHGCCNSRIKNV